MHTASGGYGTAGGGYQPAGYATPGYQQHNTTVIVTRQQPVHTVAMEIKPPNYMVMSVLSMLFCCFLFGLIALIMSVQVSTVCSSKTGRLLLAACLVDIVGLDNISYSCSLLLVLYFMNGAHQAI